MGGGWGWGMGLGEYGGEPQPDWELAVGQLGHAVARHPEAFADKSRFSMDWYYPVLGGPLRGRAAHAPLAGGWDPFGVPGLALRGASAEPWAPAPGPRRLPPAPARAGAPPPPRA